MELKGLALHIGQRHEPAAAAGLLLTQPGSLPDALAVDLQRVAVDDTGLADDGVRRVCFTLAEDGKGRDNRDGAASNRAPSERRGMNGRLLPQDKAALAAQILNRVWEAAWGADHLMAHAAAKFASKPTLGGQVSGGSGYTRRPHEGAVSSSRLQGCELIIHR